MIVVLHVPVHHWLVHPFLRHGLVLLHYDGSNIPIPRSKYEENGYKPDFDELQLQADYWAAQEKEKSSEAKNTMTVIK